MTIYRFLRKVNGNISYKIQKEIAFCKKCN